MVAHDTSSTPGGATFWLNLGEVIKVTSVLPLSSASLYGGKKKSATDTQVIGPDAEPLIVPRQPVVAVAACATVADGAGATASAAVVVAAGPGDPLSAVFEHAQAKTKTNTRAQRPRGFRTQGDRRSMPTLVQQKIALCYDVDVTISAIATRIVGRFRRRHATK
jgi:hypothetical protein